MMLDFLLLWAHGDSTVVLDLDPARTIAGAAARFLQAVLDGAPYLLCGVVLSGLIQGVVGAEAVRRRFGTSSLGGVVRASIFGGILPLGALGALPVARRLRTMQVPRGTTLAFLVSAAVLDPLSLVLGMSLMSPRAVAACVAALMVWSLGAGILVNRLASEIPEPGEAKTERLPGTATARLARFISSMASECSGPSFRDLLLAAAGAGLLGALLPSGWLEQAAAPHRPAGSLIAAAVGLVASVTPLGAMRQAGSLVRDGYSHQVALIFLAFGAGTNLAILTWLRRGLMLKPGRFALVLAIGFVAWGCLGWGSGRSTRDAPGEPRFHTHAFDELGRPNLGAIGAFQVGSAAWEVATKNGRPPLSALLPLAVLAAAGRIARQPRVRIRLIRWYETLDAHRPESGTRVWERALPPRLAATLGLVAAIPAVVALVFTYYPDPAVVFDEMVLVHTEVQYAVRLGQSEEALVWIERWDDLVGKLGPAVILRHGSLDGAARVKLDDFREAIAALRGFLEEGRVEEARTLLGHVRDAQQECRQAFGGSG